MVGNTVGVKKSIHSILGTRDARDLHKIQGKKKNDDEISDEDDDFEYDSYLEYDTINFGNWNTKIDVKKLTNRRTVNDNSNEEVDEDNDNNENDEDCLSDQSSVYSQNVIQEELEREAMYAGMRSR